jgi:hypothetical protein
VSPKLLGGSEDELLLSVSGLMTVRVHASLWFITVWVIASVEA